MKFVVTCLDGGGFRILASQSKVFTALKDAIIYGGSVSLERKAEVVPIMDAKSAADSVFTQMVEHHPELVSSGDPEVVKRFIRYERTSTLDETVCFVPRLDPVGFPSFDSPIFLRELESLIEGV